MEEQILAFVELMGGRGNEELLRPLCQAAEREMAGRLREGLSPEACGAGAMRRQAERLMAPYLADGFAFRGVLG